MQVSTGAMSYTQAIKESILEVAGNGLKVINFANRRDKLDVAVRRAVLTGVNQTTGKLTDTRADEMKIDLVQTSAHIGSRPSHSLWQGQIFSRSGKNKDYPDFVSSTGYGTGTGLMGYNCRHSYYPFFEGISKNAYNQAQLNSYADKKVKYNGKELSFYEATQQQRAIERAIRQSKREAGALQSAGIDNSEQLQKVKSYQAKMRDFVEQTGLDRQRVREQVFNYNNKTILSPSNSLEEWKKKLNENELAAIHHWGVSGADIRKYQRGEIDDKNVKFYADNFNTALDKGVKYDGTVYRGLSNVDDSTIKTWMGSPKIQLSNDQSTTKSFDLVQGFSGTGGNGSVVWEIEQKRGVSLFEMTKVTYGGKSTQEFEVVIRNGTEYKITGWDYISSKTNKPFDFSDYFTGTDYSLKNLPDDFVIHRDTVRGFYKFYLKEN
jgi:hypothetical protein